MKWFKHDTDCDESEGLDKLIQEFGFEGYGRWFRILEIVARKMEAGSDRCHVEYSEAKWCSYLLVRRPLFRRYLVVIGQLFDIKVITTGLLIRIEIPNLLNKRDNWTRRSVVTAKQLPPKSKEVRSKIKIKDKDLPTLSECEKDFALIWKEKFEEIWETYPEKKGRAKAQIHFKAQVKNVGEWQDICKALVNYQKETARIRANGHPDRAWMHGATWFNSNWKDFIDYQPPVIESEDEARTRRAIEYQQELDSKKGSGQ